MIKESNNFPIVQGSPDLQIMQKANNKYNSNRQKTKSNTFKANHFLQFHIILIDSHTIKFTLLYLFEYLVQIFNSSVNFATIFS